MSDLEETAKAVQEASKLGRDLVKGLKPLAKIAQQILGPFGEGYGLLTDLVHHKREEIEWRFANRKKIYKLALEQVRARAIELEQLNPIPTRIAHDYEDGIEREDEEILQQLWANLLINVTDPQTGILPRKVFRDILGKLDPEQALFLNELGLRIDTIQFYFIVCNAFHNGQSGCELAFAPFEARKDEIVSSELFPIILPKIHILSLCFGRPKRSKRQWTSCRSPVSSIGETNYILLKNYLILT